jgi:hypothetical protein
MIALKGLDGGRWIGTSFEGATEFSLGGGADRERIFLRRHVVVFINGAGNYFQSKL